MSPLVFLTEFQELFTLDCEETTSEENNATTSQVKTGWHHPLVSWLYRNKFGSHLHDTPWPTFQQVTPGCQEKHFCCLFWKSCLYTSMAFLINTETKYSAIRHFRRRKLDQVNFRKGYWRQREKAASHLRGTKSSCWRAKVALGKTNEGNYHIKLCVPFVCLVPVRLSLASMVVLYHVNC